MTWKRAVSIAAAVLALGTGPIPAGAQEPEPIEAGVAPAPGPYAPGVDVLHYEVEVGLASGAEGFEGHTELRVSVREHGPVLPIDFTGLEITELTVDGQTVPYLHEDGVVRVPLDGRRPADTVRVALAYRGVPDDGLILRDNVHGDPAAFVDNWPNRTRFWMPTVDHPADKATVRYTVHAPAGWRVIANGHLVGEPTPTRDGALGPESGERRTWVWEVGVPISTYNMVIGAADLEVRTIGLAACGRAPASRREDGCVEVTYWVFPEDVENAEPSFRRAAQMVDFFTELVGNYPFEKLANVQSATRFGGMENASAIFYSEQAIADGRDIESTVSHEIAHQWFGDAVTEASWHHLWLSEGFATYFGGLFFEAADGVDAFRGIMENNRTRVVNSEAAERPVIDPDETDLFALLNANNYPKGAWVLHMLRGLLGDEVFFEAIREFYRRNIHTAVLTDDLKDVMEEVSHRELDWFFTQWLHRPGYPVFEVEERWIPDEANGGVAEVVVQQVQNEDWPRFRVPLELCWGEGVERICREAVSASGQDTLRFTLDARPTGSVRLDPDGWVLKELRP
ncbi:MAG: M1 family metallopeptidase [Gemmatimonadota bacterium]|nr:M1 family metallopeptidase [Gemmatimonadota bacterium]